MLVHVAESEEEFGLFIQSRTDAVQNRRNVLAHTCGVRATALKFDLGRRGEHTGFFLAQA